jgi:hypothetical protein
MTRRPVTTLAEWRQDHEFEAVLARERQHARPGSDPSDRFWSERAIQESLQCEDLKRNAPHGDLMDSAL